MAPRRKRDARRAKNARITEGRDDCLAMFGSVDDARERLEMAATCAAKLTAYRTFLYEARRHAGAHEDPSCRIAKRAAESAYEAERYGRLLLRLGIDALNTARDAGAASGWMVRAQRTYARGLSPANLREALETVSRIAGESAAIRAVFDEATRLCEAQAIRVQFEGGALVTRIGGGDGATTSVGRIRTRNGDLGRIDAADLLGGRRRITPVSDVRSLDRWGAVSRRRDSRTTGKSASGEQRAAQEPLDLYTAGIGAMASLRDLLYVHAREMDEFGLSGVRGEAPLVAIVIALIVVAVVATIAAIISGIVCVTKKDEDACTAAEILFVFGMALFQAALDKDGVKKVSVGTPVGPNEGLPVGTQ